MAENGESDFVNGNSDVFPALMSDESVKNLPPMIITSREFCHFKDDSDVFVERLRSQGKLLEYYVHPGCPHMFTPPFSIYKPIYDAYLN